VLVRRQAESAGGHLVRLRSTFDADVLLGCVADAAGRVQRWVEIWIQNLQHLSSTTAACREALSNEVLDNRWSRYAQASAQALGQDVICTGFESTHPLPTFIDIEKLQVVNLVDSKTSGVWELCQDDAFLTTKGLPAYPTSQHRYLYQPSLKDASPVVNVSADAPVGSGAQTLPDVLKQTGKLVPLNPSGGLMLVRSYVSLTYEDFVTVLGGGPWNGLQHGRTGLDLGGAETAIKADASHHGDQGLLLSPKGKHGRQVETLHLKLRLLADAVGSVRSFVQSQQRPMLDLTADSFRVTVASSGAGLPAFWTARAMLVDTGDAIALPIATTDARYFLRDGSAPATVYAPSAVSIGVRGQCVVRIRRLLEAAGQTIVEGTFATQERIDAARNDLIWLRVRLAGGALDLYARLEQEAALAVGEWRFRTIGQRLDAHGADLKAAEGVPIAQTPFEIIPLLTSPCDLYALGVLAVRTLLVNPSTTLAIALDEMLSLLRQVAAGGDDSTPLPARIQAVFAQDKRWLSSLGPHRMTQEDLGVEEAFEVMPATLWFETLAMIARMFPGLSPDSACRDLGDAPAGDLAQVFDRAMSDLDTLGLRTRSLVVVDWQSNREIHSIIRKYLVGITGA
jgi:hypothetical protein